VRAGQAGGDDLSIWHSEEPAGRSAAKLAEARGRMLGEMCDITSLKTNRCDILPRGGGLALKLPSDLMEVVRPRKGGR